MNNSSGRWITPTSADLEREEFRKHGSTPEAVEQVLKRDILAERGQRVLIDADGQKQVTGSVGNPEELLKAVQRPGLERLLCHRPRTILLYKFTLALPMTVQFKNIRLKQY